MEIVVLGMHRSGTSATAGLLVQLGAYFGAEGIALPSAEDNAKGFWERRDVVEANDGLLAAAGAAWFAPHRFEADRVTPAARAAFDSTARQIARDLGRQSVSMIKDPRLCITFEAWRAHLERPLALIVMRHPLSSARSFECRADGSIATGLALWETYMRAALRHTRGMPRALANYDELVEDPERAGRRLIERLNEVADVPLLRLPAPGECSRFIDPTLRHHREADEAWPQVANPDIVELFQQLRDLPLDSIPDRDISSQSRWTLRLHECDVARMALQKERDALQAALQFCVPAMSSAEQALRQVALRTELHAALAASRTVRGSGPTLPDLHRMLDNLEAARDTADRLLPK